VLGVVTVAVLVLVVVLAGGGHGARRQRPLRPALAAPAGPGLLGVNVNRLFDDQTYSPAQIGAQLDAVRATGATVTRCDALWQASEPSPPHDHVHRYAWTFDDTVAGDLATHGLAWLPILDYSPPWAQSVAGQPHSAPRDDGDFAAYARAFAARYGAGGAFWRAHPALPARPVTTVEIWNEPDNGEFWEHPDAAAYARLYLASRAAIDAVDPPMRVLIGGLTAAPTFLPAMRRAVPALAGHVDGVAIHPYGSPAVALAKVRAARATLAGLGMGSVALYVTELGWTTSPPGALDYVAATGRPAWIERTLPAVARSGCGVAATILYTWITPGLNPADSQDWYGIAGTPSQAAFAAALRAAAGTSASPAPACAT
jgi:hypothetical protein